MKGEVAVVIPTYNRAPSLKCSIDSVRAQSYKPVEVIVVDDGSEDDTANLVHKYGNCRYTKIEHSGLPAVARNAGVRITDARYIAFLDSDDEWLPRKVEKQLEMIEKTGCGLVCSNASQISGEDDVNRQPYLPLGQKHSGRVLKELLEDNFVITSSVVLRRDLFEVAGGFCEDPKLRGVEDYDLWLRVAAIADVYYMDEELLFYRHADTSLSRTRSTLEHWQGMELIFARAALNHKGQDNGLESDLKRQLALCRRCIRRENLIRVIRGLFIR